MAFTFRNGKHHRNPSGCHNKVKWFLSQCHWNSKELEDFIEDFIPNELLDREVPTPKYKDKLKTDWLYGWLDAINIALYICDKEKYRGRLPYYAFEKYPWLKDCTNCKYYKTECSIPNFNCVHNSEWEKIEYKSKRG